MPETHPTTATPQPFHTRSLQVTAMQYNLQGDLFDITEWMEANGAKIERWEASNDGIAGSILFVDHTEPIRRFILTPGNWVIYDGETFNRMTNHQFNTYHHTTANS